MKKVISLILVLILSFSFFACGKDDETEKDRSNEPAKKASKYADVEVGDYIKFGTYEQDNNTSNGNEEIEWLVLDVKDGKALLISKYILDGGQYNGAHTGVDWESCSLRRWMNSAFYVAAFSADEKAIISTSDTNDNVFLLSADEAEKYLSRDGGTMLCKVTDSAVFKLATYIDAEEGTCWWWLRTPGKYSGQASVVYNYNGGEIGEYNVTAMGAIRPSVWIDLNA